MPINSEKISTSMSYGRKRRRKNIDMLIDGYIREWEKKKAEKKVDKAIPRMPPTICFSRPIGCGVQEIADILAQKVNYRVIDREILDYVKNKEMLSHRAINFFNEYYPDTITQYLMMLSGEKTIYISNSSEILFSAIYSTANLAWA